MKVLLLITKGETGGAQTHVLGLCQALAGQVQFLAAVGGSEPVSALGNGLTALGVPVHQLPQLGNSLSPLRLFAAVRVLRRLLEHQQPDVIHAHSAVAGLVARVAGRMAGVPVVYTVHGFGFKSQVPRLQRWAAWLAEYTVARFTGHMICVSEFERQLARQLPLPPGCLSVIPNAVPDTPERAHPTQEPACIVMVARLANPKRPDLLLHALAVLRDGLGHEVQATLIGSGPDLAAHHALAKRLNLQAVHFTGDVTDVAQRLAQHEIFVLVSDHEGLPISIIEAMRAGLAIVASDLPGIRELMTNDQQGLLVPNQVNALAEALARLVGSAPLRTRLGSAARARYLDKFTPDKMATPVAAIYTQLAHVHRTSQHANGH
jgi:glycosyltransferase involved in cell wall biosynthesis